MEAGKKLTIKWRKIFRKMSQNQQKSTENSKNDMKNSKHRVKNQAKNSNKMKQQIPTQSSFQIFDEFQESGGILASGGPATPVNIWKRSPTKKKVW